MEVRRDIRRGMVRPGFSPSIASTNREGAGIYCCTTAKFPVENFNIGNGRLICMRALPGDSTRTFIKVQAGPIDYAENDSIFVLRDGVTTYVIRRARQTLPCFIIYY